MHIFQEQHSYYMQSYFFPFFLPPTLQEEHWKKLSDGFAGVFLVSRKKGGDNDNNFASKFGLWTSREKEEKSSVTATTLSHNYMGMKKRRKKKRGKKYIIHQNGRELLLEPIFPVSVKWCSLSKVIPCSSLEHTCQI